MHRPAFSVLLARRGQIYFAACDAGQSKLPEASRVHAANLRQAFDGFTRQELHGFDAMLDRVRAARIR